jgi:hypothetical protein
VIHLIKRIVAVKPYEVTLLFNTEEELVIDLKAKLQEWALPEGSAYRQLLDRDYFQTVALDEEAQTICWNNGIDLCPDVLYEMGHAKIAQEEYSTSK